MVSTDYMDKYGAAEAWGLSVDYARRIICKARGAKKVLVHGKATWVCLKTASKPTGEK